MDPVKNLLKEKLHLRNLRLMRKEIYQKVGPLRVEYHPSKEPIPPTEKNNLAYRRILPGGIWGTHLYDCAWFHIVGKIPESAKGKHVVIHISIGGEGLVYEGTEPTQAITAVMSYIERLQASVGKSVIEIANPALGNEPIDLYLDGGYNGIYNVLVGFGIFWYADLCIVNDELKDFYYDYLTIASQLSITKESIARIPLMNALKEAFFLHKTDLPAAKACLAPILNGKADPTLSFTAVGHSHLDLAWLWPLRETKRKAARTFANQINNVKRTPEYIYGASQPQQFDFIKNKYPKQFSAMQKLAKEGNLELQGGMWVEADTNLSSGEALIRQIYYGKKFFLEEFGQDMKICWLPDVFGYNGNLPQILKKSGIPYFMTIKLSWNEHNKFPYRSFNWTGIDGSTVLVHMAPDENYNSAGSPACAKHAKENYPEIKQAGEALMIYGIGDGGGGPGEAHIELVKRQNHLQNSPAMHFGKAIDFFDRLNKKSQSLPYFQGELYLEKHQGTYTTQGRNKNFNRRSEYALQNLEALAALAYSEGYDYPAEEIDRWWKEVLLYQFHDIIPGSSITRVYEESRARYAVILAEIEAKRTALLSQIGKKAGWSVFNPTSFSRHESVWVKDRWVQANVSPYGFALFSKIGPEMVTLSDKTLENQNIKVEFNDFGEIISLIHKEDGFEYVKGAFNQLVLYQDKRLFYNAWDIDWKYFQKAKTILHPVQSVWFSDGQKGVCRNTYRHGKTILVQEVVLKTGSEVLLFETKVDFHETHKMLRADFVPAVWSDLVKCDIQFGTLERSTQDVTLIEQAQFEICAHKYVDVSDQERGISLLNNGKYGHRVKNGLISLNLLRSPVFPDPKADRGNHTFTYAVYPHKNPCGVNTLKEAYFINKPLEVIDREISISSMAQTTNEQIVIETIKKAYRKDAIIIRLSESQGQKNHCELKTVFAFEKAFETTLMEEKIKECNLQDLQFAPFEIKTIELELIR